MSLELYITWLYIAFVSFTSAIALDRPYTPLAPKLPTYEEPVRQLDNIGARIPRGNDALHKGKCGHVSPCTQYSLIL